MTITTIPLHRLAPSPANVRKTGGTSIDDLAASIAAHGLLQNLQVCALDNGKYEVIAGGRRLAALKRLVKQKRLAKDFAVPCHVIESGNASEISLAENVIREAMHPVDQFLAFQELASTGLGAEEIALRFGVSARQVQKLLRLASVSPRLLDLYRQDQLTLEQLMAFTVSSDHATQEAAWFDAPSWDCSASAIRRRLTESLVSADDRRARLIGVQAYIAAGGSIIRDLFQEQDEGYFTDPALLDRLVHARLDEKAEELRNHGWSWSEVIPDYQYPAAHGFVQLHPERRDSNADEQAELDRLYAEYDALAQCDDEEIGSRRQSLEDSMEAIEHRLRHWTDDDKAHIGAVVTINRTGHITIIEGLACASDLPAKDSANDNAPDRRKERPAISAALLRELSAQRTQAMRATLASQPEVALNALIYSLALPVFCSAQRCDVVQLRIEHEHLRKHAKDIEGCAASIELDRIGSRWGDQLPGDPVSLWQWLQETELDTRLEVLAYLTATSLNAVQSEGRRNDFADPLHLALGLDMADWWQPTRDSYLGRVSKAQVIAVVTEAVSHETADSLRELKRDGLVTKAEKYLSGTRWLPEALRAPAVEHPAEENLSEAV